MKELKEHKVSKSCVAHNGKNIYHFVEVKVGESLFTGQPYLEIFETEQDARKKFGNKLPEIKEINIAPTKPKI